MADTRTPVAPAPPEPPAPSDKGFWTSKWTILSVVLVGLIVVAAAWLILDDPDPAPPGADVAQEQTPDGSGTGCGPDGGSQIPPAAAPETQWHLAGSMAAPFSPAAGPLRNDDGIGLCFSPDPIGALFAAATFIATNSDPDQRLPVLTTMVVRDAGYEAAKVDLLTRGPGPVTHGVQIAGFAFQSYSKSRTAVVDLALLSEGVLVHVPIELAWTDGDWRIVLPVTGRPFDAMQSLPSLSGYVPWQGA